MPKATAETKTPSDQAGVTTTSPAVGAKPPKSAAKETFEVISSVSLDGEAYEAGDVIELTKKQAAELVACGAVKGA